MDAEVEVDSVDPTVTTESSAAISEPNDDHVLAAAVAAALSSEEIRQQNVVEAESPNELHSRAQASVAWEADQHPCVTSESKQVVDVAEDTASLLNDRDDEHVSFVKQEIPKEASVSSEKVKEKDTERVSVLDYLYGELRRGYVLENDEQRFTERRERVYTFIKIPKEIEKFILYGFFQCVDAFLFLFTFLPLRFMLAIWFMISRSIKVAFSTVFGYVHKSGISRILQPAEICDLLKGIILITVCFMMSYVDTSMMYHIVKSQSVIKLYIMFNMLEVGDKLFSSFGQDILDALYWTATEPRVKKREHFGLLPHLIAGIFYVFLHCILILTQATTLNVAINSQNKGLLMIMMSNNVSILSQFFYIGLCALAMGFSVIL